MEYYSKTEYLDYDGASFFTVTLLPHKDGSFPIVIYRTPYVQPTVKMSDAEVEQSCLESFKGWLDRGYAIVFQHCRGQGKSSGAFVPYIHEREDGLALRVWIREQSFYNGEIFLYGASYTASLHYSTSPFESDIKGAVFEVQDSERYRLWYRNGQMRKGHANWHFSLYKPKCDLNKSFSMESFSQLPLKNLSQRALNDNAQDFEEMLCAQFPSDDFWNTRFGGSDAKNATDDADIPILFTTGYNDYYIGGMFKMWNCLTERTKTKCAMLVSPYNHGDLYSETDGIGFPNGRRNEQFGNAYQIDWFDNIRNGYPLPYEKGVITYYRAFENTWQSDFYTDNTKLLSLPLGNDFAEFQYNPLNPPEFCGEGNYLPDFSGRGDVITVYTAPNEKDIFIKGQMKVVLAVSSDCPDTSFYVGISIEKPRGDYFLRHDITSLCYQLGDYDTGSEVMLNFCFDEYAFLLKSGERLRIDISSTDNNTYVCHTNHKGPYYLQENSTVATNRINLSLSKILLPFEETYVNL